MSLGFCGVFFPPLRFASRLCGVVWSGENGRNGSGDPVRATLLAGVAKLRARCVPLGVSDGECRPNILHSFGG